MHGRHDTRALERPCMRTAADVLNLCGYELAQMELESLRVLHLDHDNRLIIMTEQSGSASGLLVSPGKIVREAVHHRAHRLLIAHNHPSGDPTPSLDDHLATRRIAELLRAIEVELVDHLILARNRVFSFRAAGLL